MKLLRYRAAISVGLTLGLLLALWLGAFAWIEGKSAIGDDILNTVEPRHARLLGVRQASAEIDAAFGSAAAVLARHAYPAEMPAARIGPDVQQRVRAAAEAAGASLSGSQIVAADGVEGLDVIAVQFTLEAEIPQLLAMLDALQQQTPLLQADSVEIQAPRNPSTTRSRVQLRVSALRVQS